MTSEEAITNLKQGKKIRRPNWGSAYYIYFEDEKLMLAHKANDKTSYNICNNDILPFSEFFKDDWELYDD